MLTASGGPFRGRTREELADVTPEEALAHPTWSMGPKITIDSATLANKGLELIEAHFLFGLPYERIEVVVHPTSVVHALVRFRDGASLAHLGYPDMRVPISYALTYPERAATPVPPLDSRRGSTLEFEPPDLETFPLLALAREAGEQGGTYPCAFNAANEVAVAAFLEGRLPFLGIAAPSRRRSPRSTARPRATSTSWSRPTRRRAGSRKERCRRMSILVAILGLALPDPHPRGGPLLHGARRSGCGRGASTSASRRRSPRWTRNGIEYGIGAIPLGGYVKIPGMHRPAPSDLDVHFGPALYEEPRLLPDVERLKRLVAQGAFDEARAALADARDVRCRAPSSRRRPAARPIAA